MFKPATGQAGLYTLIILGCPVTVRPMIDRQWNDKQQSNHGYTGLKYLT